MTDQIMIVGEANLSFYTAVTETAALLVGLVPEDPDGPIVKTYDYEPGLLADAYPALTCQAYYYARTAGAFEEIRLPNQLYFYVRCYYPIYDVDFETDGLRVAQDKSLAGISAWMQALVNDPFLKQRVYYADSPQGQMRATGTGPTAPAGDDLLLYCWEANVQVKLH